MKLDKTIIDKGGAPTAKETQVLRVKILDDNQAKRGCKKRL